MYYESKYAIYQSLLTTKRKVRVSQIFYYIIFFISLVSFIAFNCTDLNKIQLMYKSYVKKMS